MLILLISIVMARACWGASLADLVKLIRRLEICAAAFRLPTTPAAMLSGSDIMLRILGLDEIRKDLRIAMEG